MEKRAQTLVLRCFAESVEGSWHAICVDLDIAAQGDSLNEVKQTLDSMVETYIEAAIGAPPDERIAMLSRKAPFHVRFAYAANFFLSNLFANRNGHDKMSFIHHRACPA